MSFTEVSFSFFFFDDRIPTTLAAKDIIFNLVL